MRTLGLSGRAPDHAAAKLTPERRRCAHATIRSTRGTCADLCFGIVLRVQWSLPGDDALRRCRVLGCRRFDAPVLPRTYASIAPPQLGRLRREVVAASGAAELIGGAILVPQARAFARVWSSPLSQRFTRPACTWRFGSPGSISLNRRDFDALRGQATPTAVVVNSLPSRPTTDPLSADSSYTAHRQVRRR